jgi:hypothetical protein
MHATRHLAWWAGSELDDPVASLRGLTLRAELGDRLSHQAVTLIRDEAPSGCEPGFTGEPVAPSTELVGDALVVIGGSAEPPAALIDRYRDAGHPVVSLAPEGQWGDDRREVPGADAIVLAARRLDERTLDRQAALLRVVAGLPKAYVLWAPEGAQRKARTGADVPVAIAELAARLEAEVVVYAPGAMTADDAQVETVLAQRRQEADARRRLPEDWTPGPDRPLLRLRISSPLALAAAVAHARAVVAADRSFRALAWALGVPQMAPPHDGSAGRGLAGTGTEIPSSSSPVDGSIPTLARRRRARPEALPDLEALLDQHLDTAAAEIEASIPAPSDHDALERRVRELEATNEALRRRMAAERLRFAERAALLEEGFGALPSAPRGHGAPDAVLQRRLEERDEEVRRLQSELAAVYATKTMRMVAPLRQAYGTMRRSR